MVLNELLPSDDYKSFIWKGVENITVKEYKKLIKAKNITEYKKLPWEKEAYYNQEHLYDKYLESKQFKDLRGKNITLDFVLDNL